jgi:phosphohistidine phosphatase
MKHLYLIRHAKSSWGEPGLADFDRPLNKRGQRDAPRMGERLKSLGAKPDLILTSPAKRALTTAKLIAGQLEHDQTTLVLNDILYSASAEDTLAIIGDLAATCNSVMVFGHNPTMTDLVNRLSDFSIDIDNVPSCGAFGVTFDIKNWSEVKEGKGMFVFFEYPKLLE